MQKIMGRIKIIILDYCFTTTFKIMLVKKRINNFINAFFKKMMTYKYNVIIKSEKKSAFFDTLF